jgi:hypothetical protein
MYWAIRTTLCNSLQSDAKQLPSSGVAASQDAVNGAAVELFEDLKTHAEYFQAPEGEEVLSYTLHSVVGMCRPILIP